MSYQKQIPLSMEEPTEVTSRGSSSMKYGFVAALALVGAGAFVATRPSAGSSLEAAMYSKSGTKPTLHAYVDALCPDCRRHALSLHEVMLQDSEVLDSVNVKVDYLMSASSLAEHGHNLVTVNHYELCAEKKTEQKEWWNFIACMYSYQDCLNYNTTAANQTCSGAMSGEDDDMTIAGVESTSESCDCSLSGIVSECSSSHITSITYDELVDCAEGDDNSEISKWADESKKVAESANSGYPLWMKVDNMTVFDNWKDEKHEIKNWAAGVFSSACNRIEYLGGTKPKQCDDVLENNIIQTGTSTLSQTSVDDDSSSKK